MLTPAAHTRASQKGGSAFTRSRHACVMMFRCDDADVARARHLMPLVEEGFAASLTEAATRFALSHPAMGVILVGMATPQQFEDALAAVQQGPLPPPSSTG